MQSGCQVCASTGQCNAAFKGGPGQYCGAFYDVATSDNKPCCCPLQATCKVSPTQCMCHVSDHRVPNYYPPSSHSHRVPQYPYTYGHYNRWSPVAPLIFILLCLCCCLQCSKRRTQHERLRGESVPVTAVPVPATCPPSENPAYRADYGGTRWVEGGGGGGGTAIASGLGGFLIGNMLGRNHANERGYGGGWFGGGRGGGYGYDTLGNAGGGYDIAGDTGGGGDFAGDSGGGYDIAGDS